MIRLAITTGFFILASPAFSQEPQGAITGTVNEINGNVADATVEAKNIETEVVYSVITDAEGFTLSQLPAGTYEISVPPLGWRTERFVQPDVLVEPGQTVRMDIELVRGNLGVIGDDLAFLAIRNKYSGLQGEAPRTADGKPDLSGVWQGDVDPKQAVPDLLPWAAAEMELRNANFHRDFPGAACLPDPVPIWPVIYRFVQTPSMLVQIYEYQPGYRQVFLDGRAHPEDLEPTWMGHSIGTWQGDTLVVETVGFNDRSWLVNGYPHTDQLRVIERFSRPDLAHLRVDVTMEDPGALATPWDLHMVWRLAPGEEVLEFICNENNLYFDNIGTR